MGNEKVVTFKKAAICASCKKPIEEGSASRIDEEYTHINCGADYLRRKALEAMSGPIKIIMMEPVKLVYETE